MVEERLKAWQSKNGGHLPKNIIFYRDGVSESQFQMCKDNEIPAIKKAYQNLCRNTSDLSSFKLTFAVVGKRHNTRFYATEKKDMVQLTHEDARKINSNLKPGLYVDKYITDPIGQGAGTFDFYLQSHNAIQGTARSAHYYILINEVCLLKDEMAELTHQLCYTFGRATKGVSYPSPAYIADRLCERGRVYLRHWNPPPDYNKPILGNGEPCKTHDDIMQWKAQKALELARSKTWPHYNDGTSSNKPVRLNPWHPDLDGSMFWM